jgi:hypothetical protein
VYTHAFLNWCLTYLRGELHYPFFPVDRGVFGSQIWFILWGKKCLLLHMGHRASVLLFSSSLPSSVSTTLTCSGLKRTPKTRESNPFLTGFLTRHYIIQAALDRTRLTMRPLATGGRHYEIKITYWNKIISSTSFQLVIKLN